LGLVLGFFYHGLGPLPSDGVGIGGPLGAKKEFLKFLVEWGE